MENIIERYESYAQAERQLIPSDSVHQASSSQEQKKLAARIEVLQRNIRNYAGEDLETMSLRELQQLEPQIDTALKRIRSRKNQLINESISELQKKERALEEQNKILAKKLKENEKRLAGHAQWEQQNLGQNSSCSMQPLQPLLSLSSLTIGGPLQIRALMTQNEEAEAQTHPSSGTSIPGWMLSHAQK